MGLREVTQYFSDSTEFSIKLSKICRNELNNIKEDKKTIKIRS